ncbi:MAG: hypothetical protein ACI9KE_004799 [Polyangiales bacterium]
MSGICCPVTIGLGCNPAPGFTGGWAASSDECVFDEACCDVAYLDQTDSYGCAIRVGDNGDGCLDDRTPDAGVDSGAADSGTGDAS